MASYSKSARVNIDLYIKTEQGNYEEIGTCYGVASDNEMSTNLSVTLNPKPNSFSGYTWTASSYSGSIDLYIKISGSATYQASEQGSGTTSSNSGGYINMNSDSLTYNGGNTTFKRCSSNSTFTTYINGSNGSNYVGKRIIDNSNTKGNYGTIADASNSGSYQMYIPTSISNLNNISYTCNAVYLDSDHTQRFNGTFVSKDYIQIGSFHYSFGYFPGDSTDANYKYNPIIVSNGGVYFNKIPITNFSLFVNSDTQGHIGVDVQCIAGNDINDNTFITGPIAINYKRPEIKLNSNLKLNFCCNPELTSTNLYYIGTEKLTNTDLVPATEWAKINFKFASLKPTYRFDAISYFYLDIKNYEDLLNYTKDSSTGTLKFIVSTDSSSNYAPYSITLYMIKFSEDGVEISTDPSTLLDSHIQKRIPYLAYYNNDIPTYNSINGYNGFSPSDMFYSAGEDYTTAHKVVDKALIVLKKYNMFECSSDNYNSTSRSIEASLKISDIIEATSNDTREHPSIISYLCEIVYLPDKPASGSDYDIVSHASQEYNKFKEYHVINIAMPRTLAEIPLSSPVTTIKDYTTLLQENYPSFNNYDINHNIQTILNTYDKPDDDTGNTVLSKKVFTDLLFYDNSATKNLTGEQDGYEKIVTGYNINTGTNINRSVFFDLSKNAANEYFTDKTTYQNTLISNLFGGSSGDDYSKVINWPIDDTFIYWCNEQFTSTNKDNWKHFNFKTPIVKNKDFSLMTCSYIDGSTNKYENFQTTENTYRNLSFTIPDKANYSPILQ